MNNKRKIYSEPTILVNFRVPKSKVVEFRENANRLLEKYDVRNIVRLSNPSILEKESFDITFSNYREVKLKDYFGGELVRKDMSDCFLIDKFKNLYRDKEFPDDFYVVDFSESDVIHFTNVKDAQKYMNFYEIK